MKGIAKYDFTYFAKQYKKGAVIDTEDKSIKMSDEQLQGLMDAGRVGEYSEEEVQNIAQNDVTATGVVPAHSEGETSESLADANKKGTKKS